MTRVRKHRRICLRAGLLAVLVILTAETCGCGLRERYMPAPEETEAGAAAGTETKAGAEADRETAAETQAAAGAEAETAAGAQEAPELLPARYDAREDGRTAPVKDQGDLGTCWAFASLLALESSLLPEESWDFSEDHMSHNPDFNLTQKEGGEYTMAMAYLLSWQGPVTEEEDPYGDGVSPENLKAAKHVQEIWLLPAGDREAIKRAVYRCGGVQSSLYTTLRGGESLLQYYSREARAYYCPEDRTPNHDVVIVGWDDDFPGTSFGSEVPGDGAFLCENSWGTQFGEDGYFYVSYYDANIGKNNVLYAGVEEPDNYDHIYQSDLCGWIGQAGFGEAAAWAVNIYTAAEQERPEAVGFYATGQNTDYEVYLVRQVPDNPGKKAFASRILSAEGHLDYAGYYTILLETDDILNPGERFGVMVKLTTKGTVHPIAIEYDSGDGKCKVDLEDGEGYISPDGDDWQRLETGQKCNLCLKAYTGNA